MYITARLAAANATLNASMRAAEHIAWIPAAVALSVERPRDTAAHRILDSAGVGGQIGALAAGVPPMLALAALGAGHSAYGPGMQYGIAGVPDRGATAACRAIMDGPHASSPAIAALIGVSFAVRSALWLPRLAVHLAMAVGLATGAVVGATLFAGVQAALELGGLARGWLAGAPPRRHMFDVTMQGPGLAY